MPAACGMACEVCQFKVMCGGGCFSGTDPKASERAKKIREMFGGPCAVLECAIKNKADYCLRCEEFPCDVHYQEFPFSKKLLDAYKKFKEEK